MGAFINLNFFFPPGFEALPHPLPPQCPSHWGDILSHCMLGISGMSNKVSNIDIAFQPMMRSNQVNVNTSVVIETLQKQNLTNGGWPSIKEWLHDLRYLFEIQGLSEWFAPTDLSIFLSLWRLHQRTQFTRTLMSTETIWHHSCTCWHLIG